MSRLFAALTIGSVLFAGSALSQSPGNAQSPVTPAMPSGEPAVALSPEEALTYRLGSGDQLRIITYDEPQLTGQFFVDSAGNISLPLIGSVPAKGRTVNELEADIDRLLQDGYIKNPSVSVEVFTFRPFFILGEVNKPGEYPYTDRLTIMGAVATAGGFTYRANQKTVFVKHQQDSTESKIHIDSSTPVSPGDTIRIGERYF